MSHVSISGTILIARAGFHTIWRSNGVITRANSTAEDAQKDTFLPSTFSADPDSRAFLHSLRPTRNSHGVFSSSPGLNQLIVAAACVTNHARLS